MPRLPALLLPLALLATPALAGPRPSPTGRVGAADPRQEAAAAQPGVAARSGETVVTWEELDRLLLDRHALSQDGREALQHLLKSRVLSRLAEQQDLVVGAARIQARMEELDRTIKASGEADGLDAYLRKEGVAKDVFREYLRLGIVQETLARRALGVPEGTTITGEQQETWLADVIAERGYSEEPPPWKDGVVCRSGDVVVHRAEFLAHLRKLLPEQSLRDACFQLLLEQRLAARLPDLAPEALERAVQAELERRRKEVEADPRYEGLPYDRLLASQGIRLEAWPQDPSVRIAALSKLWVDKRYDEDDLKRVYDDERELFDGRHGEAVEVRLVFLHAVRFPNELVKRTYEEAEALLYERSRAVQSVADFEALAEELSQDAASRERDGLLGWVTRGTPAVPEVVREDVFRALDEGRFDPAGPPDSRKRLRGPLRTPNGCAILWLGARRPAPAWEQMAVYVRAELRRRLIEESLDPASVVTFLDAN